MDAQKHTTICNWDVLLFIVVLSRVCWGKGTDPYVMLVVGSAWAVDHQFCIWTTYYCQPASQPVGESIPVILVWCKSPRDVVISFQIHGQHSWKNVCGYCFAILGTRCVCFSWSCKWFEDIQFRRYFLLSIYPILFVSLVARDEVKCEPHFCYCLWSCAWSLKDCRPVEFVSLIYFLMCMERLVFFFKWDAIICAVFLLERSNLISRAYTVLDWQLTDSTHSQPKRGHP